MKIKYLKILEDKILKIKNIEYIQDEIGLLLQDIAIYLQDDDYFEGNTTQSIVGMKKIF